ncbi:hypothetical protein LIER_15617 [Lithospermum erythrorhizon]|uniref:Uncharacterized protein n=1 Tax=Lithospermum erythrorhizon TaxID=34254 RepID=A0AAV3Q5I1_LITER
MSHVRKDIGEILQIRRIERGDIIPHQVLKGYMNLEIRLLQLSLHHLNVLSKASEKCRKSRSRPTSEPRTSSPSPSVVRTPSRLASMICAWCWHSNSWGANGHWTPVERRPLPPGPFPSSRPSAHAPVGQLGKMICWPLRRRTETSCREGVDQFLMAGVGTGPLQRQRFLSREGERLRKRRLISDLGARDKKEGKGKGPNLGKRSLVRPPLGLHWPRIGIGDPTLFLEAGRPSCGEGDSLVACGTRAGGEEEGAA